MESLDGGEPRIHAEGHSIRRLVVGERLKPLPARDVPVIRGEIADRLANLGCEKGIRVLFGWNGGGLRVGAPRGKHGEAGDGRAKNGADRDSPPRHATSSGPCARARATHSSIDKVSARRPGST